MKKENNIDVKWFLEQHKIATIVISLLYLCGIYVLLAMIFGIYRRDVDIWFLMGAYLIPAIYFTLDLRNQYYGNPRGDKKIRHFVPALAVICLLVSIMTAPDNTSSTKNTSQETKESYNDSADDSNDDTSDDDSTYDSDDTYDDSTYGSDDTYDDDSNDDSQYTGSEQLYKSKCESYEYDEILRDPSEYEGKYIRITGIISQVIDGGDEYLISSGDDKMVLIYASSATKEKNFIEDDPISIYGICGGNQTYETVIGTQKTVPLIQAGYIYDSLLK